MPEVVTGPRADTFPERAGEAAFKFDPSPFLPAGDTVVFHSRFRWLKLDLSARKDVIIDGELVKGDNPRIQFDEYTLVLSKERDQKWIDKLLKHERFGLPDQGGYFWLPEMREEALADKLVDETMVHLKDPKFLKALQKRSGAQDFALVQQITQLMGGGVLGTGTDEVLDPDPDDEPNEVREAVVAKTLNPAPRPKGRPRTK